MSRFISLFAFAFSLGAAPAATQTAFKPDNKLQIVAPLVEVANTGNSAHSGSASMFVVNNSASAAGVTLTASEFRAELTNRVVPGKVTFAEVGSDKNSDTFQLNPALAPASKRRIIVQVSGFKDASRARADIYGDGQPIGQLMAAKLDVPFAVHIDGASQANSSVAFTRGDPLYLRLRNDDSMTYGVRVRFRLAGVDYSQRVVIPPNGIASISLPEEQIFPKSLNPVRWAARLTSGETEDDTLYLQYSPATLAPPIEEATLVSKPIPIHFRLNYFKGDTLTFWSSISIFIVLLLGGLTSLTVYYGLPKSSVKADLRERLDLVGRLIGNLTLALDSRARVSAAVTRKRLKALLASRSVLLPDFDATATSVDASVTLLEKRVDLLSKVDSCMVDLNRLVLLGLPPTFIQRLNEQLDDCTHRLSTAEPTDSDLQTAATELTAAAALLDKLRNTGPGQRDEDLAASIAASFQDLQSKFPHPLTQAQAEFDDALPGLFSRLEGDAPDPKQLSPSDYFQWDMDCQRLMLIHKANLVWEDTPDAQLRQDVLTNLRAQLKHALSVLSWGGLSWAYTLVQEMQQLIDSDKIRQALLHREFSIQVNRGIIRTNDSVEFCICFGNGSLNSAAARKEFSCSWTFKPQNRQVPSYHFWKWYRLYRIQPPDERPLPESGWTVDHYFAFPRNYIVDVKFKDWYGHPVDVPAPLEPHEVYVGRPASVSHSRTEVELVRLAITLLIALTALMATAYDQFKKLDLLPALAAVFGLGFAADTVKNLLTRK